MGLELLLTGVAFCLRFASGSLLCLPFLLHVLGVIDKHIYYQIEDLTHLDFQWMVCQLGAKRYKIEIVDTERNRKAVLTLEGDVSPQLAASLVEELSEKLSEGKVLEGGSELELYPDPDNLSMKDKVELILLKYFQYGWFTSNDVYEQFTRVFGDTSLSVISTYLARLYSGEGCLERRGTKKQYYYRVKDSSRFKTSRFSELLQLLP